MDAFVSRKRRRLSPEPETEPTPIDGEEESTDVKLAILASLNPNRSQDDLLEILLTCEGSVEKAIDALSIQISPSKRKASTTGIQIALPYSNGTSKPASSLIKKGRTLHLYTPSDIAKYTPCSIIHNFLPNDLANDLLREILPEVTSYTSATFRLFDNVVQSPHTACFYVNDRATLLQQKHDYLYNGSNLDDIREILPVMRQVSSPVREAVNSEIQQRIKHYPEGKKLKYQSPHEWQPNAAFVNCYDGAHQSVGYHSDQLSYLGPRAVIGSLSLGVEREFRVRRIVPPDDPDINLSGPSAADTQGQISIHLPHNSLLVMHAEMQEEWKHSIAPAQTIVPHPVAGNKRINITYRWYREEFHPRFTPQCRCGIPTVLKCVQRRKETRGKYMWMCQVGGRIDPLSKKGENASGQTEGIGNGDQADTGQNQEESKDYTIKSKPAYGNTGGCGFFEWAKFTDDGDPIWKHRSNDHLMKRG